MLANIFIKSFTGLVRLQEVLKHADPEVKWRVKRLIPGEDNRTLLKSLKAIGETRVILDCPTERVLEYLQQANEVNFFQDYMVRLQINLERKITLLHYFTALDLGVAKNFSTFARTFTLLGN